MKIIIKELATEYSIEGEGKTILMLHGWGVDLHSFDKISDTLKQKYKVIRLDLPGFGGTERPKNWNLESYVDFVSEFINKLSIKPDILLGHSFGGRIIIKGVGQNKIGAEKIILISPAGVSLFNLKKKFLRIVSKLGKILISIPPVYFWKERIRKSFYKKIGSEYLDNSGMKEIFARIVGEDLRPYANNINRPVLLLWGRQDFVTPLSDGRFLNSVLKNSKLEVVEDSGHFSFIEKSKETVELIKNFLS